MSEKGKPALTCLECERTIATTVTSMPDRARDGWVCCECYFYSRPRMATCLGCGLIFPDVDRYDRPRHLQGDAYCQQCSADDRSMVDVGGSSI